MLEASGLCAGYAGHNILRSVDLTVGPGEIVALVGANGAGKSTLVKTLAGLLTARAGGIRFEGQSIERLSARERLTRGLSLVPEGRQIFAGLTIEANLRLGAYIDKADDAAVRARMEEVCALFPILLQRRREPGANLSGGQQQMLAIGRGLMSRPKALLLDEPSLGLSPVLVADVFRLIARLRDQGLAVLLSEQNARQSLALADRAYVIENGAIVMHGTSKEILASDMVAEKYLGVGAPRADARSSQQNTMNARLRSILTGPGA